jgi:hypothetical protein
VPKDHLRRFENAASVRQPTRVGADAAIPAPAACYAVVTAVDTAKSIWLRGSDSQPLSRPSKISLGATLAFAVYIGCSMVLTCLLALGNLGLLKWRINIYFFAAVAGDFFFGLTCIVSLLTLALAWISIAKGAVPLLTVCRGALGGVRIERGKC